MHLNIQQYDLYHLHNTRDDFVLKLFYNCQWKVLVLVREAYCVH